MSAQTFATQICEINAIFPANVHPVAVTVVVYWVWCCGCPKVA